MIQPTRQQIEALALEIVDNIKSGAHVEDSLVELKADWPEPQKAARRIAGQANASRGEGIYWIVGVDESKGVCKYTAKELSVWWSEVRSHFDGISPSLIDVVVTTDDGPIQVLFFDVSASPFVVKNSAFGQMNAGPVQREVPWREATGIRSATREDLVRLLVPTQKLPSIELLYARVNVDKNGPVNLMYEPDASSIRKSDHLVWSIELALYVTPPSDSLIVFPIHRTEVLFKVGAKAEYIEAYNTRYSRPSYFTAQGSRPDSVSIETTSAEAIIHLPGKLYVRSHYHERVQNISARANLHVRFSVKPAGTERSVIQEAKLPRVSGEGSYKHFWSAGESI